MNQKELRKENEQKIFKMDIKIENFGEIEENIFQFFQKTAAFEELLST